MELNIRLLDDFAGSIVSPVDLNACLNAHGLYNSIQCVLRLSPEVHRRIAAIPVPGGLDVDDLQAYSTYLHETIHWWQHIGSTTGLMLSLGEFFDNVEMHRGCESYARARNGGT